VPAQGVAQLCGAQTVLVKVRRQHRDECILCGRSGSRTYGYGVDRGIEFDHRASVADVGKQRFCFFGHQCVVKVDEKHGDA